MRTFLSVICILTFTFVTFGQKKLTLEEAINIAMQRNTTLQKNENSMNSLKSNVKSAYGNFLPNLSLGASWNWQRSVQDEGGSYNFQGVTIPISKTINESRNYGASVNSSWTLFDGLSMFANLSQSKENLESGQLGLERQKQTIVFQTINLYYAVVNSQQLLKVKEEDVKWNKKNLETIVERNKLGAVTLADVYSQQVQEGNAELALIQAQNSVETSKSNLLYYLGLNVLGNYTYTDTLTEKDNQILQEKLSEDYSNLTVLVNQALQHRFDVQSANLSVESAKDGVTMAWAGNLPSINGNFSYNLRGNKFSWADLNKSKTYFASLSLRIPIFSGFSVENRVELAKVNVENAKVDLDDLKRQVSQSIQKTYLDLQASEKNLEVSKRNIKAATENRKVAQEKYNLGSGTLLDVLIANSNYLNARTTLINTEYNFIVLSQQLKYYLGVLNYKQYE